MSSCINTLVEACLPSLKGSLKLLDVIVFQERCNMVLDVFHSVPMFLFLLSLESGK